MNEIETTPEPIDVNTFKPHPPGYKKWHRWQWGWLKWLAFVDFVDRAWPRNR